MIRRLSCLLLVLATASCVPPVATVVEEPAVPAEGQQKPRPAADTAEATENPAIRTKPPAGMLLLDPTRKLPDARDMEPTAPAARGGGVTVTPPASADGR